MEPLLSLPSLEQIEPYLLDRHSPAAYLSQMGGKAANLYLLSQAGLPVPEWFCLSAELFKPYYQAACAAIQNSNTEHQTEKAQALLESSFPEEGLTALIQPRLEPASFYAVRSSALSEDSLQDSFAGQFETWLHVPASEVVKHVLRCWQSAFSPRLQLYRQERGLESQSLLLAVVIQEMVPAEAAGVMFMANPMGALTEAVINAGPGLGEGMVSDTVVSDSYLYDRISQQWQRQIQTKNFQVVGGRFGGTERVPVPAARQQRSVLDPEQCQTLLELGLKIEGLYHHYQDIEWALDAQHNFWILQSRPISTIAPGEKTLFDNSNVVESYPGLSSPLTFSWIRSAYAVLFRNGVLRLGVPRQLVYREESVFQNLVGHLNGRVYYNLSHWYRMFRLVPGTEKYIRVWEEMMGIVHPSQDSDPAKSWKPYLLPWLKMGALLIWYFLRLSTELKTFRRKFQRIHREFWAQDHRQVEVHELLRAYHRLCSDLLYGWEITLLNDGYTFIFSGLTKYLLQRAGFEGSSALFNDLLCGVANMESVEPVHSVIAMAETVRQQPELQQSLQAMLPTYHSEILQQRFPDFAEQLEQHLKNYGDRCLAELKLETLTLREEPALLLRWILDYAASGITLAQMQAHEKQIRQQAERRLRSESKLAFWLHPLLHYSLKQARRCINYREASRMDRARAFGLVRHLFRQMGQRLQSQQVLKASEDIFYLSLDEVSALLFGSGPRCNWAKRVAERRQQYRQWEEYALPERILCQGPVGAHLLPLRSTTAPDKKAQLQGMGCAPGEVEGEALIVRDPAQAQNLKGKILVAEMTDPGWVFLMIQAAGLIVEKGSLLSHTAIIGRELGIPTVVGVSDATRRIQNGQRLALNGQTGEIQLLS